MIQVGDTDMIRIKPTMNSEIGKPAILDNHVCNGEYTGRRNSLRIAVIANAISNILGFRTNITISHGKNERSTCNQNMCGSPIVPQPISEICRTSR